jgi:putative ABC transport system permease protein
MAFSVVLLIGAMLLVRSFIAMQQIDLGFNSRDALTFRLALPPSSYPESKDVIAFARNFRQQVERLPGVRSVGATRLLPLTGTIGDWSITLEGRVTARGENPNGDWQVVTPGYFETMGMKLVRGRTITDADREDAPIVAVVNESMAKRYWAGDPIGKRFHIGSNAQPWITVVGVIAPVHHNAVVETPRDEMYVPHAQWAAAGANTPRGLTFVARTTGDALALVPFIRQTVRSFDPNLPLSDVRTLQRVVDNSLSQPRFTTLLLGFFAALALALAMIGIYGVISLLVTRRRQEVGIRMALGATSRSILQMVVKRGMTLAAVGVIIGLVGAVWVTRALTSLLYGIGRFDPVTFATAPLILAAVALVACAIPAMRAAAMDPVSALREE